MAAIVERFPHAVRVIENAWIPLPDGMRLAARIWLPESAEHEPAPAILEYLPYRKRDFTRARDEPMHHYFAGHGFAAVRVDVRGSGDSDGILTDEYSREEQADALEILRWIAAQPWCNGAIGMMGISWGGFNSLQVAALAPPELAAIITLCSTDDRYADDAHYMGGCLLNENLQWGSYLLTYHACPPDPHIAGERWRAMWLERMRGLVPFPGHWLRHQRRDDYWKHGSVCEDYASIRCPVYAIGGWADGYSNAVPRLLAGLSVPRKGLIGPWAHAFPHEGVPGPSIGFLQEALRWWRHWLAGEETGIMDDPMLRVWMQESVPPQWTHEERPGRWVAEPCWPSPHVRPRRFFLDPAGLRDEPGEELELLHASPQTTGLAGGEWCPVGLEGEMAGDQRPDDGRSLCFDSDPLPERVEILGAPVATLELAADRPVALVAVRLVDVAPGGEAARVTYGLLNLTHRESHEHPDPLEPERRYRVRVPLCDIAHAFPAGHRLRVAISSAYWPIAWPAPEPVTLSIVTGLSTLELLVRPPRPGDAALRSFELPERGPSGEHTRLRVAPFQRTIEQDLTTGETVCTLASDATAFGGLSRVEEIDLEMGHTITRRYRIGELDPSSAHAEIAQRTLLRREGWSVRIETVSRLTSTPRAFRFEADLEAYEGDALTLERRWDFEVPRDLV